MKLIYKTSLYLVLFLVSLSAWSQTSPDEIARLDSLGAYHFYQDNIDSSIYYFKKMIPVAIQYKDEPTQIAAYDWLFYLHFISDQKDSLDLFLTPMLPLVEKLDPKIPEQAEILSNFWNSKSHYHDHKGEFYKKIVCDRNSLQYYEMLPEVDTTELAVLYQNVGTALEQLGDFYQANFYSKKALELLRPSEGRTNIQLDSLKMLSSIARQLFFLSEHEGAEQFYQQGKKIVPKLDISSGHNVWETVLLFHIFRGDNFLKQQKYDRASRSFDQAQRLLDPSGETSIYHLLLHRFRARAALATGNLKTAAQRILKTQALIEGQFSDRPDQKIETLELLGDIYLAQKQLDQALIAYQSAFVTLYPAFKPESIYENVKPEQILHRKDKALRMLRKKGDVFGLKGEDQEALRNYLLAIRLFNEIRQDYLTEDARIFLAEQAMPLFESAIETAVAVDQPELAFQLVEQSKALSLFEALQEREAYELAGIPDSLYEQIRDLKVQSVYWEKALFERQLQEESRLIDEANKRLFELRREQEVLTERINAAFPLFAEIKFEKTAIEVEDIRTRLLGPKAALVEYFIGDTQIFIFGLTQKQLEVKVISKEDTFEEEVATLLKAMQRKKLENGEVFANLAFTFYQQYLFPVLDSFEQQIEALFIVPDGQLNYLPFEALLMEGVPAHSNTFSRYPFLIKKYSCSYAYSGTLLLKAQSLEKKGKVFVGFAPVFDQLKETGLADGGLEELTYSLQEIQVIQTITKGITYTHTEASKANFLAPAKHPAILHLSTHARVDDQNPLGSKIYLADGDITTKELYHLPYSTQLAVLSACETGGGKLVKGEGIMSLARAFMQSGSPSVVTSLWKVDDKATDELMEAFYRRLQAGMPKNGALRQAKLDYLEAKESETLHHPFFWAAFIHIGDPEAVRLSTRLPAFFFIALFGIMVLSVGWLVRWRK